MFAQFVLELYRYYFASCAICACALKFFICVPSFEHATRNIIVLLMICSVFDDIRGLTIVIMSSNSDVCLFDF